MMELWVLLAVAAAFLQNLRSALQKTLAGRVSVLGATYARFVFAVPLATLVAAGLILAQDGRMPGMTGAFLLWGAGGALGQIAGTFLLLHLFSLRNFAVGNTLAKTETVQAALFGLVLLGDRISAVGIAGILVSLMGVAFLSAAREHGLAFSSRTIRVGLASGAAFAFSGVAYRAASLGLVAPDNSAFLRAALTLACVTGFQTLLLTGFLCFRMSGEVGRGLGQWRIAAPIGAVGMLASFAWFSAFTMVSAAQVKAVGQVELVFSYITARFAFGERPSLTETLGIAFVSAGIVLLILTG